MATAGRGVLYMVWGKAIETLLQRSIASVKQFHPELPIEGLRIGLWLLLVPDLRKHG